MDFPNFPEIHRGRQLYFSIENGRIRHEKRKLSHTREMFVGCCRKSQLPGHMIFTSAKYSVGADILSSASVYSDVDRL